MLITIAICTWNNAELLDDTLAEMEKLEIPDGVEWELLIVNNNCTDHTDEVIEKYVQRLPIRRLLEQKQGLSHARNCAVAAARGELLLWTDDDVLVDQRWLAEYVNASNTWPEVSFFGGLIDPYFSTAPPKWLTEVLPQVAGAYAIRDLGKKSFLFDTNRTPFGANYAISTEVQQNYPYDTRLGRKKNVLMSSEETLVIRQMLADGFQGRWLPNARVRHHVAEKRFTTNYLRRFFFYQGKFAAIRDRDCQKQLGLRSKLRLFVSVVKSELKYLIRRRLAHPKTWICDLRQSSYQWGQLLG